MHNINHDKWDSFLTGPADQALLGPNAEEIIYPFDVFWISIHDHWLSEDEAAQRPIFYPQFQEQDNLGEYLRFEHKFLDFLVSMHALTSMVIYGAKEESPQNYDFYLADSADEVLTLGKQALRGESSNDFILPEYQVVIVCGHDLTWPIYAFEKRYYDVVKTLAKKNALNILEPDLD